MLVVFRGISIIFMLARISIVSVTDGQSANTELITLICNIFFQTDEEDISGAQDHQDDRPAALIVFLTLSMLANLLISCCLVFMYRKKGTVMSVKHLNHAYTL